MAFHRLTKLIVGVPDIEATVPFYRDFGLDHLGNGHFATVDGGEQLELSERLRHGLIEIGVGCDDSDDLDRVGFELARSGLKHQREGDFVCVRDEGSGALVRVGIAPRYHQRPTEVPAVNSPGSDLRRNERAPGSVRSGRVEPRRLGHVVIGSTDIAFSENLFINVLGFKVSDTVREVGKFVRCSTDHHNLMVIKAPAKFLHHTSWQVNDIDEVGRGAANMLSKDPSRHAWGLGRHNIGGNFFWYVTDPAGNFAEYYSDLDIITENMHWDPGEWGGRESLCAWGPRPPKGFFRPPELAGPVTGDD